MFKSAEKLLPDYRYNTKLTGIVHNDGLAERLGFSKGEHIVATCREEPFVAATQTRKTLHRSGKGDAPA